ncbi:MAG: exodeoxyribonuclease III [Desulfovibrionaceae bacterium]
MDITIYSWNVNGYRAIQKKEEGLWLVENLPQADIIGIQESRVDPCVLSSKECPSSQHWQHVAWLACKKKKGYSGVATFSKREPLCISEELPDTRFQDEGRVLHHEYPEFHFLNIYFPNGQNGSARLQYKMEFYDAFLQYAKELRKSKPIIAVGDYNTAHKEIDLTHPKQNMKESGFLPEERAWIDSFIEAGYIDTFRYMNPEVVEKYSWWSYKTKARERNVGWRIDYIFISEELRSSLQKAWIADDVYGSDHCPVGITLSL